MALVHGRNYLAPIRPTIVVCLDGSDPEYLEDALGAGVVPTLARWRREGAWTVARGWMPSFTNPNNLSIVTGVSPAVHGIAGNYYFDVASGEERSLTRVADVRGGDTILTALAKEGVPVAAVTAKKKLLAMLTPPPPGLAFSAEDAGAEACAIAGRGPPELYSADSSLFVLELAHALLAKGLARLVYASTTDYVQHKHAPGSPEARAFYAEVDRRLAALEALGARIVLTADHGMSAKTSPDGSPRVVYLEPLLPPGARVVLSITDPYVKHHGSLGGVAMIYGARPPQAPGIAEILTREEAAARYSLPPDRIGDFVVLAEKGATLGKSPAHHELGEVAKGLRSHGGPTELDVPLLCNHPRPITPGLHNSDAFAWALS